MVDKINSIFSVDFINELAKKSKFIQRRSKLTAVKFLDLMLFNSQFNHCLSLNQLAIEASSVYDMEITKQGLDQRINDRAVDFFKLLLQHQLNNQISQPIDTNLLSSFNRVRIKDSTKFDVNSQLEEELPGYGGAASLACTSIQYKFDLNTGNCIDLSITPALESDYKNALNNKVDVHKGDLIIRDLGYFGIEVLKTINSNKALYLSKLKPNVGVFEKDDGKFIKLDFDKLYKWMTKNGIKTLEKEVYIGGEAKMPTRLMVDMLPKEIYEKKLRKVTKERMKKGRKASENYSSKARFNLTITNATTEQLNINAALFTYRLRCQVELVFKLWKSNYGIILSIK